MNKITIITAIAMTVVSIGTSASYAEGNNDFNMVDGNRDNMVSYDEARGAFPTLAQSIFDQVDANKDGMLDESEFGELQGLTAGLDNNSQSSAAK